MVPKYDRVAVKLFDIVAEIQEMDFRNSLSVRNNRASDICRYPSLGRWENRYISCWGFSASPPSPDWPHKALHRRIHSLREVDVRVFGTDIRPSAFIQTGLHLPGQLFGKIVVIPAFIQAISQKRKADEQGGQSDQKNRPAHLLRSVSPLQGASYRQTGLFLFLPFTGRRILRLGKQVG